VLHIGGTVFLVHRMMTNVSQLAGIGHLLAKSISEMEINANKIAWAVNYHVYNPLESCLNEIKKAEHDFEHYSKEFKKLAATEKALALGEKVTLLYVKLKTLGDEITSMEGRPNEKLDKFKDYHMEIDRILKYLIQPLINKEILRSKKNTLNAGKIVIVFILAAGMSSFVLIGILSWLISKSITQQKQAEDARKKLLHNMGERVRELQCMYNIEESVQTRITLEEILQDITGFIPMSLNYPEIAACKLSFENKVYVSQPFKATEWKYSSDIVVNDKSIGSIDVYYLSKSPLQDNAPFLKEEKKLIGAIGKRLGRIIKFKHSEKKHTLHMRFLENITKIDQVIMQADSMEKMMSDVLQTVLEIFECDRAWLLYPCDPDAKFWTVPMECTQPGYTGGSANGKQFPMTLEMKTAFQKYLANSDVEVVDFRKNNTPQIIATEYSIKSEMNMPISPRLHKPWVFGIHQCSHYQDWTIEEQDLFRKIGNRFADALTSLLFMRDLHKSEQRFKSMFNSNRDGYAIVMGKGEILDANPRMLKMLGYSKDELKSKGLWQITQEQWYRYEQDVQGYLLFKRGHTGLYEKNYVRKDGTVFPVEVQAFLLDKGKSFESSMIGTFVRDITERKRSEKAMLSSEKRFRNLIENSPTGIIIIQHNKIVYRNPINISLVGVSEISSLSDILKNIHHDDMKIIKQDYQKLVSGKKEYINMEFRFYPEGTNANRPDMKWFHCTASLICFKGKESTLLNLIDITITKELDHILRFQDKMMSLGRVAAGIAHEIRNPLSGINIYLNTLKKITKQYDSSEKTTKILSQLQSASNKIESVIKRVMDFARPAETRFALTDINVPIIEAVNLTAVTLRKSNILFSTTLSDSLPKCKADSHMIEQVILNLITNASEAMHNNDNEKKINISSFWENNNICIKVSDSGHGIPEDIQHDIFEPFYTTKNSGSGIGLSICHRIITDHGGTLELSPYQEKGAEFIIKIPIK